MIKRLYRKIVELINEKKKLRNALYKVRYSRFRDKCIEYCTQYDCTTDTINLPPSHKVDSILPYMVRGEKDLKEYNKRFPYRELIRRLDECYSY